MSTDHCRWDYRPAETRVESGLYGVKEPRGKTLFILGVSSHAHAGDRKHCSKQRDSTLLEGGESRVLFRHLYTWNVSLVMVENQCIDANQHTHTHTHTFMVYYRYNIISIQYLQLFFYI